MQPGDDTVPGSIRTYDDLLGLVPPDKAIFIYAVDGLGSHIEKWSVTRHSKTQMAAVQSPVHLARAHYRPWTKKDWVRSPAYNLIFTNYWHALAYQRRMAHAQQKTKTA